MQRQCTYSLPHCCCKYYTASPRCEYNKELHTKSSKTAFFKVLFVGICLQYAGHEY